MFNYKRLLETEKGFYEECPFLDSKPMIFDFGKDHSANRATVRGIGHNPVALSKS